MRKVLSSIAIVATAIFPFARVSGEGAAFVPPDSIVPRDSASGAEAYTAAVCAAMQAALPPTQPSAVQIHRPIPLGIAAN